MYFLRHEKCPEIKSQSKQFEWISLESLCDSRPAAVWVLVFRIPSSRDIQTLDKPTSQLVQLMPLLIHTHERWLSPNLAKIAVMLMVLSLINIARTHTHAQFELKTHQPISAITRAVRDTAATPLVGRVESWTVSVTLKRYSWILLS